MLHITGMSDETPSGHSPTVYRTFTDSTGVQWMVWKVAEATVKEIRDLSGRPESPSLDKAWLVFLSSETAETRRIAPVPANWRQLSIEELEALLREARPFHHRS